MLRLAKERYSDKSKKYLFDACGDGCEGVDLSQHKQELSEYFICPYIDYSLFERLSINKVSFYEVCEEYDLPYPKTLIVREEMLVNGQLRTGIAF